MPNNLDYLDSEGLNALWNRIRTRTLALQSSINELNTNKIERVSFDTTTGTLQQIRNNVASSIVSASVLKTAMNLTKADVGLSGVDDNADENVIEIVKVNGSALTVNGVDKSVNVIVPIAASSNPLMDGSVSVGTSDAYARADHIHPSDTTRAPQVHTSLTTTYGGATPAYLGHVKLTDTLNSQYTAETYTATTPSAVYNALVEAKAYADDIAEAASVGEPNVIENITINGSRPLQVWNKTVDIDLTTNLVNGTTPGTIKRVTAIPEEQGYILGDHAAALGRGTYAEGSDQTVIGRFNKLTGRYVADAEPEICHYNYGIGDYECKTWVSARISQYFIFDEIVSIELSNKPLGSVQPEHDEDSRIKGECDFKLEDGILKIRYPKEEEEEESGEPESGSESGTEGDSSSGGGSEGDPIILPPEPTEPTVIIMDAYIWINYRSGTYVPDNTYAFVIGNGTYNSTTGRVNSRSNALTVDWDGNLVTKGGITCDITSGILSSYLKLDNGTIAYYLDSSSNNITDTPYQLTYDNSVDTENTNTTYHWGILNLKALTVNSDVLSSNDVYESSLYTNYDGHLAIDSDGVDFVLPSGSIIINPDAEIFTDGRITMSNGSIDAISIDPTGNYPSITVTGSTSASNAYNSDNPRIEFQNSAASQNIQLIFTDFDSVQSPASLTVIGNQGGEYFIAPNIKATGNFYGNLSGNVTGNATTASYLQGLSSRATTAGWGNQNGTVLSAYGTSGGGGWVLRQNGGQMNMIIDGFYYQNEGNNLVLDTANYTSYVSSVRDNGNGAATTFQYSATGMNYADYTWLAAWSGYTLKAVNKSQFLASTGGTLSGNLTVLKSSGESEIIASNGKNNIYLYANSDGRTGIYGHSANDTGMAFIARANNANTFTLGGGSGQVLTYGYNYGAGAPIVSQSDANHRVSHMYCSSTSLLQVCAQTGSSTYTTGLRISLSTSDKRMKENIKDADVNALSVLNQIKMRQFDWIVPQEYQHQNIGMIADEIEQIDPHLASGGGYDEDGNMNVKSIDTFYLMGYLVKAVQELSAEVERLKKN